MQGVNEQLRELETIAAAHATQYELEVAQRTQAVARLREMEAQLITLQREQMEFGVELAASSASEGEPAAGQLQQQEEEQQPQQQPNSMPTGLPAPPALFVGAADDAGAAAAGGAME